MDYKINLRLSSSWLNLLQDQYIEHDYLQTGIGTSATNNVELALKELIDTRSGLEKITENSQTGWRLIGRNSSYYGDIGNNATDFSTNTSSSTTKGATGEWSFAEGLSTTSSGQATHTEGYGTLASGDVAHAQNRLCNATGNYSHAQNRETNATGEASTSCGYNTLASGSYTFAGGKNTIASGLYATTLGYATSATNYMDFATGYTTIASGGYGSFTSGWNTQATERSSHAEGYETRALVRYSHAEGYGTKTTTNTNATYYGMHVEGRYNIGQTGTIHEIGIGTDDTHRKNGFEVYTDGTLTAPESTVSLISSRGNKAVITKEYIDSFRYRETISTASSAWTITHNLGEKLVNVTVMDSNDTLITPASVSFDSTTQTSITFSSQITGEVLIIK